MTESGRGAPESPSEVVQAFYRAVDDRDAEAIGGLIDRAFQDDVVLALPPSLPYGGRVEGARRLRGMFTKMATSSVRVGPDAVTLVGLVDGGDQVVARLEFDWYAPGAAEPVPSGALEHWTFADGRVQEIRAYYWDTAACVQQPSATAS